MNQATRHMTPDAWLGVPLQLAIRDLAVVNGYAGALSVRTARRGTDAGRNRPLAVASVAVPSHGFTLLFRLRPPPPLRARGRGATRRNRGAGPMTRISG